MGCLMRVEGLKLGLGAKRPPGCLGVATESEASFMFIPFVDEVAMQLFSMNEAESVKLIDVVPKRDRYGICVDECQRQLN